MYGGADSVWGRCRVTLSVGSCLGVVYGDANYLGAVEGDTSCGQHSMGVV